ncbi:MAG TPA: hypothetical protein VKO45_04460 [Methanomicrobiales archaeon]|nr:hypothetical protein [Methanomicrobiales archaeon]
MNAWIETYRRAYPVLLLLLVFFILVLPSQAIPYTAATAYSTDFSTDPGWSTNNPATNYWDKDLREWHYLMRDGSGAYVNVKVPYHGESFTLAYDILPERTDYQASVKFGLGDNDQVSVERLTIFTEFENSPYGRLIWIRSIDGQNQRREASSYYLSYGGPTVQFTDGVWYHVVMDYRLETRSLTISVTRRNDSQPVWHYSLDSLSVFPTMNRIYMSKIGDNANPNAIAEGYIDNVVFSLVYPEATLQPSGQAATPLTSGSPAGTTGGVPSSTARPVPLSLLPAGCALAVLVLFAGRSRRS